jgi:hypothetical protein
MGRDATTAPRGNLYEPRTSSFPSLITYDTVSGVQIGLVENRRGYEI